MQTNYSILLEALLLERDRLLKHNPELIKYQIEIDSVLDEVGDCFEKRIDKLNELMFSKLQDELIPAREKLALIKQNIFIDEDVA